MSKTDTIRYAVVGQGWFAQEAILPAFANATENSQLAALVSGDATKREQLAAHYGVPAFPYEKYDELLASGEIDAVFIATTNTEHQEYTEQAARAGVHVLCEKPMSESVRTSRAMYDACEQADVKLMIAYRLHFEETNLKAIELVQSGRLGKPRLFNSTFTMPVQEGNSRLRADLGGGPLKDIGIYCINGARYLFQDEPIEVTATCVSSDDPRFAEVPEMVAATMVFPDNRLATFICGFGGASVDSYRIVGTEGDLRIEEAYGFSGEKVRYLTIGDETEIQRYPERDHIAPQIIYFSDCILHNKEVEPDGREGLIDMIVIEAIEESARTGRSVKLGAMPKTRRPEMDQQIHQPPAEAPELVRAESPHQK